MYIASIKISVLLKSIDFNFRLKAKLIELKGKSIMD